MRKTTTTRRHIVSGPDIVIRFTDLPGESDGWYDPDQRVILIHRALTGRPLIETLLHELGHLLLGDDATLDDELHDLLEEWAKSSANLLRLLRPEAVPE